MSETYPCLICGRELTDHGTVTNHAFSASSPASPPPGISRVDLGAVALWARICGLVDEWGREPDPERETCVKTIACLRPHEHAGECWPDWRI